MQKELIHFPNADEWAYELTLKRSPIPGQKRANATNPSDVADYLYQRGLAEESQEHFLVMVLDTKNNILGHSVISKGLVDRVHVHAREVFRVAILNGASKIILAHNHPTGSTYPSPEDIATTESLHEVGEVVGISVIDHVIVGYDYNESKRRYTSMRKRGYFKKLEERQSA